MADRRVYSFSEIVNTITTRIANKSSSISDFTPGSGIRSVVDSVAHFVEFLQLQINVAFDAFAVSKARGEDLDNRVQDFNISRKSATNATAIITFSRTAPATETFVIYTGSQVSTQPDVFDNTIDYLTSADIVFPSGATSVTGEVICAVAGTIGNQPSGTITNITGSIPGVDEVTNLAASTDGSDTETDEQLRKRLTDHINGLKAGNESAIKSAALAVDGITVARIDENVPRNGEITVYISNQSGVLTDDQIDEVKAAVEAAAAFGITANVATPTVTYVTIELDVSYDQAYYDQDEIEEQIKTAIYNFVSVNPETELRIIDIILQVVAVKGIRNVKNIKIDGVAADYEAEVFGVIRTLDKYTSITVNYV